MEWIACKYKCCIIVLGTSPSSVRKCGSVKSKVTTNCVCTWRTLHVYL